MNVLEYYAKHLGAVFPSLLRGAVLTIQVTALSEMFGIIIGMFAGLGKLSKNKIIKGFCGAYVDLIRGTPLLVQVFLIYFGLPNLVLQITGNRFPIDPFVAAVWACSINSGAYVAEIFRSGIQSIEKDRWSGSLLGMNKIQAMQYIILPQAFRRIIIPPLGRNL